MSARSSTLAVAALVLVGVAGWVLLSADESAPPQREAAEPSGEGSKAPVARSGSGARGVKSDSTGPLYRPSLRTDRVSVVGAEAQGRVQGITPEEAAKFEAIERPSSPIAIQAGEEEKERRREESRQRRELRKSGIDPEPRDRGDSGPGERVGEVQEVLDEQADQAEHSSAGGAKP